MDKQGLRALLQSRTAPLSATERKERGERIVSAVWDLPEVRDASAILLYAALPDEVPTRSIADEARQRGIEVVYPRCLIESRGMALHRVPSDEDLLPGAYGIFEPGPHCALTEIDEIDVAFLPGLGFDRRGRRLGRGAGYYDRLLARPGWRALNVGLFFAIQEVLALPADPWDVPLDRVITEREVIVTAR